MIPNSKPTFIMAIIAINSTSAFTATPLRNSAIMSRIPSQLDMFGDGLKNAFSNDDSLGKKENAGLKKGPKVSEVTVNGKPIKAVAGQKVSQVMSAARVKRLNYLRDVSFASCKKGDCGTCELMINGRIEKACNAKIPLGKCTIQTC
ncbi:hypothetical protein ACHAXA_006988 [Cyclostephanos tholiformis]|uniref:2Fe-2S ferredoxin-type domain-containing protein n=1 Tax=Cyclostephanos tholiformis TaxID=382380 RepID=A0ABD3R0N6_9STRA